jgi:hypothetical protein
MTTACLLHYGTTKGGESRKEHFTYTVLSSNYNPVLDLSIPLPRLALMTELLNCWFLPLYLQLWNVFFSSAMWSYASCSVDVGTYVVRIRHPRVRVICDSSPVPLTSHCLEL